MGGDNKMKNKNVTDFIYNWLFKTLNRKKMSSIYCRDEQKWKYKIW